MFWHAHLFSIWKVSFSLPNRLVHFSKMKLSLLWVILLLSCCLLQEGCQAEPDRSSGQVCPPAGDSASELLKLSTNLSVLLHDNKYTDVTFLFPRQTRRRVHKAILASRSTVFARMFENTWQKVIHVEDANLEVIIDAVLGYVYTGKVTGIEKQAEAFLAVGDKYQLEYLKTQAETYLLSTVTYNSAPRLLLLSTERKALSLKAHCIDFIINNLPQVLLSQTWITIQAEPNSADAKALTKLIHDGVMKQK